MTDLLTLKSLVYCKSSIKPPGACLFQACLRAGLIVGGGGGA